ncbi:T9SS type A sorting domain-containing protein [candidate division KSB1 bacterium]|nr:T9SS type A sorting domain-containing protein [candidate division KSB1 bacterium]NIR68957.1 T9SS type A sorting domain-containing protein [candidate division KSB1 bacterium]NIS27294.1 T9SS type A sorting domain-containing protein [candidate division KSB1 bacterium]NIT74173.1 T9SS type A sorting domain-containing protein [candidate division KSB1 bacterium]NIU28024.1 T9SS type A sorting domain-containing protein [candidate division KSB1 bacterium]
MFLPRCYARWIIWSLSLILCPCLSFSQTKTLDRPVDPVIRNGAEIAEFIGAPIDELGLFAFDSATQTWAAIPFQIDEKDTSGSFVFPDSSDQIPGFDKNDELVFMADDAGDRAFIWLNNEGSEQHPRVEITVSDPRDMENNRAWAYLYRSADFVSSLAKSVVEDYVMYTESPNPGTGEDLVEGFENSMSTYKIGGNEKGLFGALFLPANPDLDLIDRQKIRGETSSFFFPSFDEENNLSFKGVKAIDGRVRVIREVTISLTALGAEVADASLPVQYFRNSLVLQGDLSIPADLPLGIEIELLRHSIDLSSNAEGMLFSNPNNTNVVIDASSDNVDPSIVEAPEINFTHIVGPAGTTAKTNSTQVPEGTIVTLFSLPGTIGDVRQLFYLDKSGEGSPDEDNNSFGDSGVIITGNDIEGAFPLAFNLIFFADNQPVEMGSTLADNAENPLVVETASQDFETVPVELASFSANVVQNDVELLWVTASESNNFGFDIERRSERRQVWSKIGFVQGQGTTNVPTHYSFSDAALQPGVYKYRLKQIDTDGTFEFSRVVMAVVGLPEIFVLAQNFPNPFNPTTEIQYQIPINLDGAAVQKTILKIFNLLGQEVRTLIDREEAPGFYSVEWNGRDDFGNLAPSGVYIYRLRSGNFVDSKKMVLVE